MKVLIACDSYKDSLSSKDVAKYIKKGFKKVYKDASYDSLSLADGGEGTVNAVYDSSKNAKLVDLEVINPLGEKTKATYTIVDKSFAVIEMASASGLELVPLKKRDPMNTTTYGFGELIEDVYNKGIKKIILGLGGSATNDVGVGMLQALGVKFFDKDKKELGKDYYLCAKHLKDIVSIDASKLKKYRDLEIVVASDVSNPLCGKSGASYIYGAQKGADEKMIEVLDKDVNNFSKVVEKELQFTYKDDSGFGAAGGMGFALVSFLGAKIQSGIDTIMELIDIDSKIKSADLVITGEGRVDKQTAYGKAVLGVIKKSKKYDKKVIVIAGSLGKGYKELYKFGVDAIFDITPASMELEELFAKSKKNLFLSSFNIARILKMKI